MDYVEYVLPEVVVACDVSFESITVLVEGVAIDGADVADVAHVEVDRLLQVTQLSERVDDNTEKDVYHHNDHQNVEGTIERKLHKVQLSVIKTNRECGITNTTTVSKTCIEHLHIALHHGCAEIFIGQIFELVDVCIDIQVLHVEETNCSIDKNDSSHQQGSHQELTTI